MCVGAALRRRRRGGGGAQLPARPPLYRLPHTLLLLPACAAASQDGFGLDEKAGTCKPCPAQATACTVNATGTFIDSCARGYGLDAATGQCKACGIENWYGVWRGGLQLACAGRGGRPRSLG